MRAHRLLFAEVVAKQNALAALLLQFKDDFGKLDKRTFHSGERLHELGLLLSKHKEV